MLTLNQNTAICDITFTRFVTKNGKKCACSELFFIDGCSIKHYDFGKLALQYQFFVNKRIHKPTDVSVKE